MDVPIVRTDDQYDNVMLDVEKLTKTALEKDDDASLTPKEEHDLRLAAIKVKGLIGFKPQLYTNYMLAGKIAFRQQDYPTAQVYFYQCLQQPWSPDEDKTYYIQSFAEAHYMISRCLFLQHIYQKAADEAQIAARYEPQSALYRLAEAEAEAQLGHDKAAIGILKDAHKIDPKNTRVILLYELITRRPEPAAPVKSMGSS